MQTAAQPAHPGTTSTSVRSRPGAPARLLPATIWTLGALSLAFSFWAITVGWGNSIFDFHGFRQAQTAISAYSIEHGGPILRYQTPVMGPPWSLPFEFPLYQALVAALARLFAAPLDQTGRLVSVAFFYLSFFPLAAILSRLGLRRIQIVPALALFAASPFYIFISRLFMIESTALFFSLMYVDGMQRVAQAGGRSPAAPPNDVPATGLTRASMLSFALAEATVCGVLAGLVKVTTFAPFYILGAALVLLRFWRDRKDGQLRLGLAALVAVFCLGLPVALTAAWTRFADSVKAQNPMSAQLTSHALQAWNFGTFAQRLQLGVYVHFFGAVNNFSGSFYVALLVFVAAWWLGRGSLPAALVCLALYAGTIELFFNLHSVHLYYAYSNGIFVVVAVGLLLGAMLNEPGPRAWIGVALFSLVLVACGLRYFHVFYPVQSTNAPGRPEAAALVDRTTAPNDVLLITGLDWSSEFPYQSHRRAIMAPWWLPLARLQPTLTSQDPAKIKAVVACDGGRSEGRLPALLRELHMPGSSTLHADTCDIYERSQASP